MPSTGKEHMEEYLRKNGIQGNKSCQEVSNRFNNKAFKIGVPLQYRETVYSEDFWPSGIKFRASPTPWKYGELDIMKILNWNVEGLKTVVNNIREDILNQFDACTLAETFTLDIANMSIRGFYNIHILARQGERG
jgi:hypothetical protein